jgi:hypothetical protein
MGILIGEPSKQAISQLKQMRSMNSSNLAKFQDGKLALKVSMLSRAAWFVAGTPTNWAGTPITVVMRSGNQHPAKARSIGRAIYNIVE